MISIKPLAITMALSMTGIGMAFAAGTPTSPATALPPERPHHVYLIGSLRVTQPWIDVNSADQDQASAYLIVENRSTAPDRLTSASLAGAASVSLDPGGKDLVVPPMGTLTLKSGDAHLVLHGLQGGLLKGPAVDGTVSFERSGTVHVSFLTDRTDAIDDDQTSPSTENPVDLAK